MSESPLRFIPADPEFRPSPSAVAAAESLLRSLLPQAECVSAKSLEGVEFVDAGANWEGVHCSVCGADAEPWWGDAMSQSAEAGCRSLQVLSGCCRSAVSLNGLRYGWSVGFASFILEAQNPQSTGLSASQLEQLGRILGCPIRQILAHL